MALHRLALVSNELLGNLDVAEAHLHCPDLPSLANGEDADVGIGVGRV